MATIDERVVEMRFDNKDFETNVQTSLKTIDKLKKGLDFKDASKSLEDLQDAAKHFSLDDIGQAIENLSSKFNWENIFKIGLLGKALDIVSSQIHKAFSTITNKLMLEQTDWVQNMALGWDKYAEKTNSVATIMAATGDSLENVNAQMEKLMFFTDETSYNFTDMAGNIGKFTANGISLEDSVSAMEGIANWAARSGQEAAAASRVMYNLSQAIGMGALKLQDWKSVELANMGTKEFKQVAIQAGLASGALKKVGNDIIVTATEAKKQVTKVTTDNFRETLKEGWLDSKTLVATLKEYGKASELISEINANTGLWTQNIRKYVNSFKEEGVPSLEKFTEALRKDEPELADNAEAARYLYDQISKLASKEYEFSLAAYEAGQEARTFEAAMKSVSDAVSSGWMKTFELLFGGYERAKELWSDLAENLFVIFRDPIDSRNEILAEANISGWDNLSNAIAGAGVSAEQFEDALVKAAEKAGHTDLSGTITKYKTLTNAVKEAAFGTEESTNIIKAAIDSLETGGTTNDGKKGTEYVGLSYKELKKYGKEVRAGKYGWETQTDQINRLMKENKNLTKEQATAIAKYAEASHKVHRDLTEEESKRFLKLAGTNEEQKKGIKLTEQEKEAMKEAVDEIYTRKSAQEAFVQGLINSGHIVAETLTQIREVAEELIPSVTAERLVELATQFKETTEKVRTFIENSEVIKNVAALIIGPLGFVLQIIRGIVKVGFSLLKLFGVILSPIVAIISALGAGVRKVNELTGGFNPIAAILETLANAISTVADYIQKVFDIVYPIVKEKLLDKLSGPLGKIKERIDALKESKLNVFEKFLEKLNNADPTKTAEKIINALSTIWNFLKKIKNGDFEGLFNFFKRDKNEENYNPFEKLINWWEDAKKTLGPIGTFIDSIIGKIRNFKNRIKELTADGEMSTLSAIFVALKEKIVGTLASLGIELPTFEDGVSKIGQAFEWLKGVFSTVYNGVVTWLTPTWEAIKQWFSDNGINFGGLLKGGALTLVATKLLEFLTTISKAKNTGSAVGGLTSALNPLTGTFEDLKKILANFSILKFAVAMALLAYSLSKLGELGASGLGISLGTLGGALIEFVTTFAVMSKILGGKNGTKMIKVALGMLVMTWALRSFAKVIEAYSNLKFDSIKDVLKVLGVLFLAVGTLTRLAKVTGKFNFKFSNGMGLIAAATALWLFGKVLNSYTKLKINGDNILKVLLGLLLAIVTMSRIAKVAGSSNFKFSNGMALILLATSLFIFAGAVKKLGKIDTGILVKGGLAVTALSLVISLMVNKIAKSLENLKLRGAIGALLILAGVTTTLIVLAGLCYLLGRVDSNILGTGALAVIVGLGLIVLAMHFLCKSLENIKLGGAIGGLLMLAGMVAMLVVFAAAVVGLGYFGVKNPKAYLKGLLAIAVIIGGFLAVAAVMKHSKTSKLVAMTVGLLAAAASMYIAVLAIERLAKLDSKKAINGVLALGLLLAEFVGLAALNTFLPIMLIGEIAVVALMKQLAEAIEPLVGQIERLGNSNADQAKKNLENIKAIIDLMFELAGKLAANVGLYNQGKQAAELAKLFGESLRPLCDDTAILGGADPDAAAKNFVVVKGLIQLILDLAEMLSNNTELFTSATQAADLARLFGESLRPLCDDTALLGDTNPENAQGSLLVVQGLIDTMLELADKLIKNVALFTAGMAASTLAKAFGEGLKQLCEDVVTLGSNQSAETSLASVETVRALINTMIEFAGQLNDNAWLFTAGQTASTLASSFGEGLKQLCEDTVILGDNANAVTSLASVMTVTALIDVMIRLAKKLNKDQEILSSAQDAAGVASSFGKGLEQLCKDVEILGKADISNTSGNLELLLTVIGTMMSIAEAIQGNDELYEAGVDTAGLIAKFGWSLVPLSGVAFALSKINSGEAVQVDSDGNITGGGFLAVTAIIDYMLALAKKVADEAGLFEKAKNAADMCKAFGEGLAFLTGEAFVAQFINPEKSAEVDENGNVTGGGFKAVAGIIDYMIGIAQKFGPAGGLTFRMAEMAADSCKKFAGGLAGLVTETFALGFSNSVKASANFATIQTMLDYLVSMATTFRDDSSLFDMAETMTSENGVIRNFAKALAGLVVDVILASFSKAENAKTSVEAMKDMVTMLTDLATTINNNSNMGTSLTTATAILAEFGTNMQHIVAGTQELGFGNIDENVLSSVLTSIKDFITGILILEGDADAAARVISGIADMFLAAAQLSRDKAEKIFGKTEFQNGLGTVFEKIKDGIQSILNLGDISQASAALEGLGSIFEVMGDLLYLDYNESDFGASISGFVEEAKRVITQAVSDIQESMGSIDFSSFDTNISELKASTIESMKFFGNDIVVNISNGILEAGEGFSTALITILKNGTSVINAWKSAYYNAGYNVIIGFNNGLVSGASIVYNNARKIAEGVVNILKTALKIKSPSRVFAEIGEYAVLGLAKGFEDSQYEALNSVEVLGNSIITAMQNAMAYASDANYGLSPMITPVVDMNNMNSQAASINSMINGFNLKGIAANANIDGATINNTIQSRDIINEIKQLNERMAIMDDNLQNLQVVLDTGVLVGQTSAKMDNQFGLMAMRKGRGN